MFEQWNCAQRREILSPDSGVTNCISLASAFPHATRFAGLAWGPRYFCRNPGWISRKIGAVWRKNSRFLISGPIRCRTVKVKRTKAIRGTMKYWVLFAQVMCLPPSHLPHRLRYPYHAGAWRTDSTSFFSLISSLRADCLASEDTALKSTDRFTRRMELTQAGIVSVRLAISASGS